MPTGGRRTRQSRSAAYYDLPCMFLRSRGSIPFLFLHRQSFLCCVLPALALPKLPVTLLKASLIIQVGMRGPSGSGPPSSCPTPGTLLVIITCSSSLPCLRIVSMGCLVFHGPGAFLVLLNLTTILTQHSRSPLKSIPHSDG